MTDQAKPAYFLSHNAVTGYHFNTKEERTIFPIVQTQSIDMGMEEVPSGSEIPEHAHEGKEEVIFIFKGQGKAYVGDQEGNIQMGSVLYVPPQVKHRIVNTGSESLWLTWTFVPPGEGFKDALKKREDVSEVMGSSYAI